MAKFQDVEAPYTTYAESAAPGTPAAGLGVVYEKTDGKFYFKNDSGTEYDLTTSSAGFAPQVKFVRYSTNNLEFASSSYTVFTGPAGASIGTALDLTLSSSEVTVGDTIEVGGDVFWDAQAVDGNISFGSLVGGSIINTFPGNKGIPGLVGPSSQYSPACGSAFYVVQSGDLSSGALTVRPQVKGSSASVKRLISQSTDSAHFWIKNWGAQ